jgi:hypothetical protein
LPFAIHSSENIVLHRYACSSDIPARAFKKAVERNKIENDQFAHFFWIDKQT